MPVHL
jgi:hypothetical protein